MCRKLAICLVLIMASVSYGTDQLLGTFEQNMWGPSGDWVVQDDEFGAYYAYYQDFPGYTVPATEQTYALGLTPYVADWSWSLSTQICMEHAPRSRNPEQSFWQT